MSKKLNITFDLETLGNSHNAPIVQIAAVKFRDSGEILEKFLRTVDITSLSNYNFQIDIDSVEFWSNQPQNVFDSVFNTNQEVPIKQALQEFMDWIKSPLKYVFWSHAIYDPPILNNSLQKTGISDYIHFKLHKDIRTLNYFVGKLDVQREGLHHNALDDCIYQSKYISKGILKLQKALEKIR